MVRNKFFESTPKNTGLVIPEMAVFLKNDCKEGKWMIGESDYGSKLEFLIIHFSRRVSEYMDGRIAQGQIWLTPITGEIPTDIVYYTLIKNSRSGRSGSLKNFGCQVAIAQSQGYDPRELVWIPKFVKKSGAIEDENGVMQNASWYVLDWTRASVQGRRRENSRQHCRHYARFRADADVVRHGSRSNKRLC